MNISTTETDGPYGDGLKSLIVDRNRAEVERFHAALHTVINATGKTVSELVTDEWNIVRTYDGQTFFGISEKPLTWIPISHPFPTHPENAKGT